MTRREAAHSGTRCYTNERAGNDASIVLLSDGAADCTHLRAIV
jgi:hypothetical protein